MIILDTNVVSEATKIKPEAKVIEWQDALPPQKVFLTSVTVMEMWEGMQSLPEGNRKIRLERSSKLLVDVVFKDRILPFDHTAAKICGDLIAESRARGWNGEVEDAQIAAIALANGFAVATRNVKDFQFEGLKVINPWDA